MSFDKGTKVVQWGKESTVNPYIQLENTYLICDLTPYTKLTLLEGNLCDLRLGKDVSDKTQKPSGEGGGMGETTKKTDLPKFRPFMH